LEGGKDIPAVEMIKIKQINPADVAKICVSDNMAPVDGNFHFIC
jgi:hypothetical protein